MTVTTAEFWDRVAPDYSKKPITDSESYARKLAATQALETWRPLHIEHRMPR